MNTSSYFWAIIGQRLEAFPISSYITSFCSNLGFSSHIIISFTKVAVAPKLHSCTLMQCKNAHHVLSCRYVIRCSVGLYTNAWGCVSNHVISSDMWNERVTTKNAKKHRSRWGSNPRTQVLVRFKVRRLNQLGQRAKWSTWLPKLTILRYVATVSAFFSRSEHFSIPWTACTRPED